MKKLLSTKKFQLGFTLIELLVVITIIAILIAVGAVSYTTVNRNARNAQRASDLNKIAVVLEEYYADHGQYLITSTRFQSAGWYQYDADVFACIMGEPFTTSINSFYSANLTWPQQPACKPPFNNYISNATDGKIRLPYDPLANSLNENFFYSYGSKDGQSYALVSPLYEGDPPTKHLFTQTPKDPYWDLAMAWNSDATSWEGSYVLHSPTH